MSSDRANWGRLSSSTSSIRSTNYTPQRNYGPSLSSYRYSASSYTPGGRYSSSSTATTSASEHGDSGSSGSALTRSSSTASYSRTPYTSPATLRSAATTSSTTIRSTAASSPYSSSYGSSSAAKSNTNTIQPYSSLTLGRPARHSQRSSALTTSMTSAADPLPNMPTQPSTTVVPTTPLSIRSRSSSAISSYRSGSLNVRELNQQARDREERDRKNQEYREWEEREKQREAEEPPTQYVRDFRKKVSDLTGSTMKQSPSQTSFTRSISSRSELAPLNGVPSGKTSPVPTATSPIPPPPEIPYYQPAAGLYKPTAKVQPYDERDRAQAVTPGFTGLRNIGNTCFMNATLQMLVNNADLKYYFLNKLYKSDVNPTNPLGFHGRLADAFCDFMRNMWNGQHRAIEPAKIKELVAEKASQFANFAQHDAHEFLSFLLDGLHEDLNRVKAKPLTNTVQGEGREDIEVSSEAWHNHTLRNDSIFVDLFHGQLKSRLQCPKCDGVSITFDPFLYLPVTFPKVKKSTMVHFWPLDTNVKPIKINVSYSADGTVQDLLTAISDIVRVPSKNLRMIEAFSHRIQKRFEPSDGTSDISTGDMLYVFQVHDRNDCNDEVVELNVVQRQLYSASLRYACSNCGTSEGRLRTCEACYNAYYCNKDCQSKHWPTHRDECRRRTSPIESVGQPFIVSLPKNQLTYQQLIRVLEARCRYSVDIFQPPQDADSSESSTRSGSECSNAGATTAEKSNHLGAPPMFHKSNEKSLSPSPNRTQGSSPGPKRQSVLPEPRKKYDGKMFLVRKLADANANAGDTVTATSDPGALLELESGSHLALCWHNLKNGKPYFTVDSKRQLDIDETKSEQFTKSTGGSSGGRDATLQDMLSLFSETERLKPEESWYCGRCKEHVEATKKLELFRLPPVLIVQMKRFVYTASYSTMHRRSKDERPVVYPISNLDMRQYLATTSPMIGEETIYDLTGVVCHSGSSYFGHYISLGRLSGMDGANTDVEWRSFDDSIVTKISNSAIQSQDAYLLFYRLRGTAASKSIFRKHYSCDPTEKLNGHGIDDLEKEFSASL